ncbi:universal stress protein [Mucilaginibacter gilvus]|uniref:Universal stress protein n=1 Tax=Mucilaginibacter gilvus TaxID=2305909 RepID=A0A444MQ88_9SPHI|nr:universal stress protein [Mucilaginibacter gilvus]RWY53769.1 universal stress protein [Mucilaginibacter gilvus]
MKTILITTDFSPNAAHAAAYGYNLAKQAKANIMLANAINIPAEMPQSGMIVWPMEQENELMDGSTTELQKLKAHLEQNDYSDNFRPSVSYVNEAGRVTDVIEHIADKNIGLIVIGKHSSDGLSTFLLGNHCSTLIDTVNKPLLIVPEAAPIKPVKKIAFGFDFNHINKQLDSIYQLIALAKPLNADILLTHVYKEQQSTSLQLMTDELITDISNKANYPHIYYRAIKNSDTEKGLNWLCEHGHIDILAMEHRHYNFIEDILNLSHTQKMAAHIAIPLLVFHTGN